jgi:hypothetical protein
MSVSKRRRDKRRAVHYNAMCVAAVLDGIHPSWLPKNDQGNLRFARYQLECMLSSIKHTPSKASAYSLPKAVP